MKSIVDLENLLVKPYIDKEITTRAALGAHNLARPINSIVHAGLTLVTDSNGVTTVSGTAESSGGRLNFVSSKFTLKAGTYKIVGFVSDLSKYISIAIHNASNNQSLGYWNHDGSHGEHNTFTLAQETECFIGMNTLENTAYGTNTYKFSFNVQLVSDPSTKYAPYAMTNQELTDQIPWKLVANTTPFTNDLTKYNELMFCGMRGTAVAQTIIIPKDFITSNRQFRCDYGTSDNVTLTLNSPPSSGGRVNYTGTFFENFSLFGR